MPQGTGINDRLKGVKTLLKKRQENLALNFLYIKVRKLEVEIRTNFRRVYNHCTIRFSSRDWPQTKNASQRVSDCLCAISFDGKRMLRCSVVDALTRGVTMSFRDREFCLHGDGAVIPGGIIAALSSKHSAHSKAQVAGPARGHRVAANDSAARQPP